MASLRNVIGAARHPRHTEWLAADDRGLLVLAPNSGANGCDLPGGQPLLTGIWMMFSSFFKRWGELKSARPLCDRNRSRLSSFDELPRCVRSLHKESPSPRNPMREHGRSKTVSSQRHLHQPSLSAPCLKMAGMGNGNGGWMSWLNCCHVKRSNQSVVLFDPDPGLR